MAQIVRIKDLNGQDTASIKAAMAEEIEYTRNNQVDQPVSRNHINFKNGIQPLQWIVQIKRDFAIKNNVRHRAKLDSA